MPKKGRRRLGRGHDRPANDGPSAWVVRRPRRPRSRSRGPASSRHRCMPQAHPW
ncbi:MAG: hypothetical protein OZSIB_2216 [Candidatus Ozemobacter sibiricus]|uniref:Uncharacterized protein n=1 Tax=Candidatus Ozemobacter sibiricus TaxID=2268124 RepID=A0A367ZU17_9BACT|nr:MAG: hypothetical protein OZSIB_2216 [Candidatus Ozemobacter sibiricus]